MTEFYASLKSLGLGYNGPFLGLKALTRQASGSTGIVSGTELGSSLLLHPAIIDSSLQALLAARNIDEVHTLHVPVSIEHIAINPQLCKPTSVEAMTELAVEAFLDSDSPDGMRGDINVFDPDGHGVYQIEGFHVAPISTPEDRGIFSKIVWGPLLPQAVSKSVYQDCQNSEEIQWAERCALLVLEWMDQVLCTTHDGSHPICRPDWLDGTLEDALDKATNTARIGSDPWDQLRIADPVQQDFREHSYDLIVAADMIWCAESLVQTLENIRRLLKPGGYLVVRTGTNTNINRLGLIVSSLKRWWSDENGNPQSPVVSLQKWDLLLKTSGFGGLEAVSSADRFGYESTFVTQAIDDHSPCYENITAQCLASLKMVMNSASRLLWVTSGPESKQPYLSMSKATVHCLTYENPQSIFQYLNIPNSQEVTAPTLANIFMQLVHTYEDNNDGLDVCLHSTEFELRLVNGVLNIPRIQFDDTKNQRWCWRLPDSVPEGLEATVLMRTAAALLATYVVDKAPPDTMVMIYKAETLCTVVCDAVSAFALARNVRVLFVTNVQAAVPTTGVLAYDRIVSLLPEDVVKVDISDLARTSSKLLRPASPITVGQTFFAACGFALQTATLQEKIQLVPVQNLQGVSQGMNQLEIVDWTQPGQVHIQIQTASSMVSLSPQKTYLLVGMTGDLGRSVCQWMVSKGARTVVLGSRSPNIDAQWILEMERLGAQVFPMAIDVTNRESVCRAYASIRESLPPIGGVANGAMVLKDCLFAQTTLEDIQSVMAPKVQGSIVLSEVFGDLDLEFFILFGSAAGPLGNVGQTAYSAATEFMSALINQRHEKGLIGSIIHPGLIKGVGYFARADSTVQNLIERNTGASNFTERDLHELFAEGILAGHPNFSSNPEVIAGYQVINAADNPNTLWLRNPKAWNLITHAANPTRSASGTNDNVSAGMQIKLAKSTAEAREIITEGFIKEVRSRLQLSAEESLTGASALTEMGVDSLVAIELRHWFVKELSVDIPVLQIIGGSSIQELAGVAASKLSKESMPDAQTEVVPASGTDA
ncbi:hypothetical protein AKAW_03882 [Aspergillus luchuensis IFO 4308]|nr:hypothetical protein AKAW_03882 [Aspergillus luchuensis IFO 4308]